MFGLERIDWQQPIVVAAVIAASGGITVAVVGGVFEIWNIWFREKVKAQSVPATAAITTNSKGSKRGREPRPYSGPRRVTVLLCLAVGLVLALSLGFTNVLTYKKLEEAARRIGSLEFELGALKTRLRTLEGQVGSLPRQNPPPRYVWEATGLMGDIRKRDLGSISRVNGRPADSECSDASHVGRVVVCPDDNRSVCHLKSATVEEIRQTNIASWKSHPGEVWTCRRDQ